MRGAVRLGDRTGGGAGALTPRVVFASPAVSSSAVAVPAPGASHGQPRGNPLQLIIAIGAFVTCFAAFGSLAGMMPVVSERLHLSEQQVGLVLALPIFVGGAARIPLGVLADRMGPRAVLIAVLSTASLPVCWMPVVQSYGQLLACAATLGVPLAVFSVGVALVSSWYPPDGQGTALGVLGFGNVGHSLALFGTPLVAAHFGYAWGFRACAVLLIAWLIVAAALARNAPHRRSSPRPRRRIAAYFKPLAQPQSWTLGLFYSLTFGGFLAMAAYLPKFLTLSFHITRRDAGLRAAGFVVLTTAMRPVGGWLADRVGGRRVLAIVFPFVAIAAACMAWPRIDSFTVGALAMAAGVGAGNGAVFALVGERFRGSVGTVTGLVGAMGAMGGFVPPILLGLLWTHTGSFAVGFVLLAVFALACWQLCRAMDQTSTIVQIP